MIRSTPAIALLLALTVASAFQAPRLSPAPRSHTSLQMAEGKKRRRKRKIAPTADASSAPTAEPPQESQAAKLLAQEQLMFDEEDLTDYTPIPLSSDRITAAASKAGYDVSQPGEQLSDIFDAGDFLAKKREKQLAELENDETLVSTKKIKRSDIQAYTRLLEMDPLADEDSRYFEDENKIDFISALLGDVEPNVKEMADEENRTGKKVVKKTSFLGIGSGPLQLGHFFGALAIVLCAFVEYPGFPLTNLPDPLRGALQGGLGTIYLINTVLAVFAAISAPSRNQPSLLWAAKTFAVGGIAYDQLMQIPTPEEAAEKARKEQEAMNTRGRRRGKKGQ